MTDRSQTAHFSPATASSAATRLGKLRRLQRISDRDGFIRVAAIDHPENYLAALRRRPRRQVRFEEVVESKLELVAGMADHCTAVLVDPVWSFGQGVLTGAIPGDVGIISGLERLLLDRRHVRDRHRGPRARGPCRCSRSSEQTPPSSWCSTARSSQDIATEQHALVRRLADECDRLELPLVVEPLWYALPGEDPADPGVRRAAVRGHRPIGRDLRAAGRRRDEGRVPGCGRHGRGGSRRGAGLRRTGLGHRRALGAAVGLGDLRPVRHPAPDRGRCRRLWLHGRPGDLGRCRGSLRRGHPRGRRGHRVRPARPARRTCCASTAAAGARPDRSARLSSCCPPTGTRPIGDDRLGGRRAGRVGQVDPGPGTGGATWRRAARPRHGDQPAARRAGSDPGPGRALERPGPPRPAAAGPLRDVAGRGRRPGRRRDRAGRAVHGRAPRRTRVDAGCWRRWHL